MEEILDRPSADEKDEDLLQLQKTFFKNTSNPSVKVVKMNKSNLHESGNNYNQPTISSQDNPADSTMSDENRPPSILHEIIEKNTSCSDYTPPKATKVAFPEVTKINGPFTQNKKRVSLFAQQKSSNKQINISSSTSVSEQSCSKQIASDQSHISYDEKHQISQENEMKLTKMSEQDILREQKKLMETLDPNMIEFIKSKRNHQNHQKPVEFTKELKQESEELKRKAQPSRSTSNQESEQKMEVTERLSSEPESPNKSVKRVKFEQHDKFISTQHSDLQAENEQLKNANTIFEKDVTKTLNEMEISSGKWLHMDDIENEKLQWLTNVNLDEKQNSQPYNSARFDFDGKLVANDTEVDSKKGLHHHSEEPQRAGYSVDEIFLMTRSTTIPQRVLGLQLLGRILHNNDCGMFVNCFDRNLKSHLLSIGVVPLLRFALDDSTETTISAAVYALKCLMYSQIDEFCLDATFNWHKGFQCPLLSQQETLSKKDIREMTDEQILKFDVIQGLLRMDLLQRLIYISKLMMSDHSVICNIIQIFIRIARHSVNAASMVIKNYEIMKIIFSKLHDLTKYLFSSDQDHVEVVYNCLKLVRVLASTSKDLAVVLVTEYKIMDCITPLLGNDRAILLQGSSNLILQLNLEGLRFWRLLLVYGLSSHIFLDLYSVIMKHIHMFSSLSLESTANNYDYDYSSMLISILEGIVLVAFGHKVDGIPEHLSQSPISFSHVSGLLSPFETCLRKWFWHMTKDFNSISDQCMVMITKCLDLMNTFCFQMHNQQKELGSFLENSASICQEALVPFLQSESFTLLLNRLWKYSALFSETSKEFNSTYLTSLGTVFGRMDTSPILRNGSPFPLLTSISSLVFTLTSTRSSPHNKLSSILLDNTAVRKYLKHVIDNHLTYFHWCKRYELHFIYYLVRTATLLDPFADSDLYYAAALAIIPHLQNGDEEMASNLFEHVIFDEKLIKLSFFPESQSSDIEIRSSEAFKKMLQEIKSIKKTYIKLMIQSGSVCSREVSIGKIAIERPHETLFPADWIYLPLVTVHRKISTFDEKQSQGNASFLDTSTVLHCLMWIFFMEYKKYSIINKMSFPTHYCRLSCSFLCGGDVFMDGHFQEIIYLILIHMIQRCSQQDFDFRQDIPGIPSFMSFYEELLIQYEAVSYGDKTFGSFILIPLQQNCHKDLKICLWNQHTDAVRILSSSKFKLLVPVQNYLSPLETDSHILRCYFTSLVTELVKECPSSILYLITIHHLHEFLTNKHNVQENDHARLYQAIEKFLFDFSHKNVARSLLNYDGPDLDNISLKLKETKIHE